MCTPEPSGQDQAKAQVKEEKGDFKRYTAPPLGDLCWIKPSESLFAYLEIPRSIPEIIAWGKERGMGASLAKSVLAYLSCHGKVDYDSSKGVWARI